MLRGSRLLTLGVARRSLTAHPIPTVLKFLIGSTGLSIVSSVSLDLPLLPDLLSASPGTDSLEVVWADFDLDGDQDAVLLGPSVSPRLFLMDEGRWREATDELGLQIGTPPALGARWVDVNGDDRLDLHLFGLGLNRLWRQEANGQLIEWVPPAGWDSAAPVLDARWLDLHGNGTPDLALTLPDGLVLLESVGADGFREVGTVDVSLLPQLQQTPVRVVRSDEGAAGAAGTAGAAPALSAAGGSASVGAPSSSGTPLAGGTPGSAPITATAGGPLVGLCAAGVADQAGGSCIQASRVPTLDQLLPLGPEFFVDPSGDVGIGTLTPERTLHVQNQDISVVPFNLGNEDLVVESVDSALALISNADGNFGSHLTLREAGGVQGEDLWGILRTVSTALGVPGNFQSRLEFTFGADRFASNNPDAMVIDWDNSHAHVGINTNSPSGELHVAQKPEFEGLTRIVASARNEGSSEIGLYENPAASFGTVIRYDGLVNQMQIFGENDFVDQGPHMVINRDSGRTSIGTTETPATFTVKILDGTTSIMRGLNDADETVFRVTAEGRTVTRELEITGGADLVEGFGAAEGALEPGTVVVIDAQHVGGLATSTVPYDRAVAGIVSGAGGVRHGIRMGQADVLDGDVLLAMSGRVWCKASTEGGAIRPGDLLTTAELDGHAMRAHDADRREGAVIGKAMSELEQGSGLVLVLVGLQ